MAPHRPVTDEEDDDDEEESVVTATTTTDQSFDHHRHQNHHHREEQQQQKMVIQGRMQQRLLSSAEEEEEEDARNDDDEERKSEDDELTSLSWLQNRNLLQTCISGNDQSNGVGTFTSSVHGSSSLSESVSSTNGRETQLSPSLRSNGLTTTTTAEGGVQRGSSSSLPSVVSLEFYNPTVHVCTKPPYSFSCLIFMAIEDSPNCALPVKDIYSWILSRFPYFQNAPTGWKNSVRHNLSLNKCFLKVDKGQNIAKGSLWCVDPEYRPNLIQALRKTPYNPYHHIQLPSGPRIASKLSSQNPIIVAGNGCATNLPNPDLFPFLSKRLAASAMKDPEVDAAATMLALKNGPHVLDNSGLKDFSRVHGSRNSRVISPIKERRERRIHEKLKVKIGRSLKPQALSVCVPVITVSPTEDHTYSSTNSPTRHTTSDSPSSSIDEPFEFGGGSGGGVLAGQLSPRNRALLLTGHNGDGDSGGDSGVTRSATSESDEEYTSVVREFAEVIKEESSSYEMTPRVTPVRCPVIVRTVTTTSGHCKVVMDDEEQQKIVDGADALLNLAGIRTHANEASVIRKRSKARRKRKLSRRHLRHLVPVDEAHR